MNDSLQSISLFLSFSVHGIYRRNPEENTQALLSSITFSLAHICTCTRTHTHIHASSIHNFLLHGSGTESGKYLVLELLLSCLLQTIFKGKIMKISTSKSLSKVSFLPFTCHKCSICNSTWTLQAQYRTGCSNHLGPLKGWDVQSKEPDGSHISTAYQLWTEQLSNSPLFWAFHQK